MTNLKNDLCTVVPLPNHDTDWLIGTAAQMKNQLRWSQEPGLKEWLMSNRLDGFTNLVQRHEDTTPEQLNVLGRLKSAAPKAGANMPKLMAEAMQIIAARQATN